MEPSFPSELVHRLAWLIRLRWVAVAGIAAVALITGPGLGLIRTWPAILVIAGALGGANLLFRELLRRDFRSARLALAQIGTDLVALTFLLHYSGSLENPFIFYYVFHVIIGSILLTRRQSWLVAAGAAAGVLLMAVGEGSRLCPHHSIGLVQNWSSWTYLAGVSGVVVTTLFISVYLATTIMEGLRTKEEELRSLHERLAQTEKLAAIGQLATGVAHQLNTPLASIAAYAEEMSDLLRGNNGVGAKVQEYSDVIRRQTDRCKTVTQSLLNFARPAGAQVHRCDVNYVVGEALEYLRFKRPLGEVSIETRLAADLPPVLADPAALLQVVLSLLVNALDAVGARGRILVETRLEGSVAIRVGDDGCGITPENLDRVFEPFFTTKEVGKGTGLGLSISRDLVRRYGGDVALQSALGKGTSVTITLPGAAA